MSDGGTGSGINIDLMPVIMAATRGGDPVLLLLLALVVGLGWVSLSLWRENRRLIDLLETRAQDLRELHGRVIESIIDRRGGPS